MKSTFSHNDVSISLPTIAQLLKPAQFMSPLLYFSSEKVTEMTMFCAVKVFCIGSGREVHGRSDISGGQYSDKLFVVEVSLNEN